MVRDRVDQCKNSKSQGNPFPPALAVKRFDLSVSAYGYALTAPEVMPSMYRRELNENMITSGIVAMTKPAIMAP